MLGRRCAVAPSANIYLTGARHPRTHILHAINRGTSCIECLFFYGLLLSFGVYINLAMHVPAHLNEILGLHQ